MKPVERVLERLDGVRANGSSWTALCPAHDDHEPSLSVTEGDDARVLLKCFAGCDLQEIVEAVGLEVRDLFEDNGRRPASPGNPSPSSGGEGEYKTPSDTRSTHQPVNTPATLESYAAYVGLRVEFLKGLRRSATTAGPP